ncbi:MAG TPA: outer membrane protein assembly factor BamA [Stellaceae bacterium]|jgi:outer membrane protein insertion porin family|nr:outer membrane protein assembly factor BamA [Stellaceae bacterium]
MVFGVARRFALAIAVLAALVPRHVALAQAPSDAGPQPPAAPVEAPAAVPSSGDTIQEIRVDGTQRVDPDTVRSYLQVQPGDAYDASKLDASLKALYATGLFSDVTMQRQGNALLVHVVENPVINRIQFEGNSKLTDENLNNEVQLRPRLVFTREKVQADVVRILELYRRSGHFAATVQPKVIELPQNRVDLVFEIDEGPSTGIRGITFLGDHEFSESTLRDVISTKESRWYRFLSSDDTYDPDRLTYDRELLRKFYLSQGYADFRVVSAVAELAPDRSGFLVTFSIEEGERYHFGKVALTNELKDVDPASLRFLLATREGDWYNADLIDTSVSAISDALGNRGYAFVQVTPTAKRNADTHTIDVAYDVKEGPEVYVERIDITGNLRTQDKVIRREFRLVEGDAFNTTLLKRSKQRIDNLGFFKKADVTNDPGSAPDKTIIHVNVQEQSTGEFQIGVGYSTTDGPLANIGIHERNLLGRGQDLRLDTTVAFRTRQVDLSFTEPYFLNRDLAAGFDIFALQRDFTEFAGYIETSYGASARLGYQFTEALRQTLSYTVRSDTISNIVTGASPFILAQAGTRLASIVGQVLLYDKRDSRLTPTSGYFASYSTDVAGLGGQVFFLRNGLNGGYYYPIAPSWVASLTGETGYIKGLGEGVRIEDRYFIGGDNLRGFASGGVGPRDLSTNDALGANLYWLGSVQLSMPLGLPKEFGLSGHVFSDFGSAWKVDNTGPANGDTVADVNSVRVSAGYGFSWQSPLGPLRLDLALPVVKEKFDKKEFFRVGFGSNF